MAFGSATTQTNDTINTNGIHTDTSGGLSFNGKRVAHPAVDVEFTIGDEAANVRIILVQFKDAFGNNVVEKVRYRLTVLAGASDVLATGGSTGIADGGAGVILETETAKLKFDCLSDANGLSDFDWTDTGTESVRLAVTLPNGNTIISDAFANA